nr:MAG TPA: hypothetical protein [Caudoviricetes sp.]
MSILSVSAAKPLYESTSLVIILLIDVTLLHCEVRKS